MPLKSTKWGFKVFILADSVTNYISEFIYFSGAGKEKFKPLDITSWLSKTLYNHHVYFDNWYSSGKLLIKGIRVTATIRKS